MLNKVFRVLVLWLFSTSILLASSPKDEHDRLIKEITAKVKAQMARNALNTSRGKQKDNSYITQLNSNEPRRKEWTDERGDESQIFDDVTLELYDAELKDLNESPAFKEKSKAVYTVVINDWKIFLETTVSPFDNITSLDQFKSTKTSYEKLKAKMELIPLVVQKEVTANKHRENVEIYLVARIYAYDDPDPTRQDVRAHRYIYFSFTDVKLGSKLKGVGALTNMSLTDLVHDNIKTITRELLAPPSGLVNLPNGYIINEQGEKVSESLQKATRIIVEAPDDRNRSVYDYSNMISSDDKLKKLEQLCANLRQGDGKTKICLKIFYTDYKMGGEIIGKIQSYMQNLGRFDAVAWIHCETDTDIKYGMYFGQGLEAALTKNFLDYTKDYINFQITQFHKATSIPVRWLAYLAGGLSDLIGVTEISAKYYDAGLPDYDPKFFILYYVTRTSTTGGAGVAFRSVISDEDDFIDKLKDGAIKDYDDKRYEFAFNTGLWNGVVTELKGVTDAVRMISNAYTDPPTMTEVNKFINSVFISGQLFTTIGEQLKDRYSEENYSSYAITHHSAKDIVAVATLFIGVGEISGAAKTSAVFAKLSEASKLLDFFTLVKYGYRTIGGLRVYQLTISKGKFFFSVAKSNANIVIKLFNEAGQILKNADLSLMRRVEYATSDGTVRGFLYMDPADEISGAIKPMKDVARDAFNNRVVEMTDAAGKQHLAIEVTDASKVTSELSEVATLLERILNNVPDELKPLFRSDFENNLEILTKFDKNPRMVDAWKALKDANADDAIRKGANGELDVVRKYMDDFPNRDVPKEIADAGGYEKWEDDVVKEGNNLSRSFRRFDVAGEFAKGNDVVDFSIEWGGQKYKLTWSKLNGKIDFGDRDQLARILGTSGDVEAHHLISWTKGGQHRVVQTAANDGFHLNMVENGIGLKKYTKLTGEGLHGNHPAYDDFLTYRLDEFAKGKGEAFTPREANEFLQNELIPEVKKHIINADGTQLNLNEYFKQVVNKNIGVSGY